MPLELSIAGAPPAGLENDAWLACTYGQAFSRGYLPAAAAFPECRAAANRAVLLYFSVPVKS